MLVRSTSRVPISRSVFILTVSWTSGVKLAHNLGKKEGVPCKDDSGCEEWSRNAALLKLPEPRVRLMYILAQGSKNEASQTSMQRRIGSW